MDVDILTTDDAVDHIEKRLLEDWLIIEGDRSSIQRIEEMVYTPGTAANDDYEIIGFPNTIHLGRKTEKLKAFLRAPPEWETLQFVGLTYPKGRQVGVILDAYDPDILTKEQAAAQMAAKARAFLAQRW